MNSVNFALRKIYFSALSGISYNGNNCPAFYQKAPDDITNNNYIVFGGINNVDVSGQVKADTDTSIRVTIHTFQTKYNDGRAADDIAQQIFDLIYPDKQTHADMSADGFQLVATKLTGDQIIDYRIENAREYLDRILIFTHQISHNN